MTIEGIFSDWRKKKFKPVYWLGGEEEYYIDKLVKFAETKILTDSEASFNLTVFYGRDASWGDIINACRRYPMFSEKQVVIIKEAQNLKEIDKLEPYISHPLYSTILVIAYKNKKLDARTRFAKLIKEKSEFISTKKMYDNALPEWVNKQVSSFGYSITGKANALLVDHIGNDLGRIENEIEKILVNLTDRKTITEDDIENFIGISKDYNIFELQSAIAEKNFQKAIQIIKYFGENDNAPSIHLILPSLFAFFSKAYMASSIQRSEAEIAQQIGVSPYFVKNYVQAFRLYGLSGIRIILLLLGQYNLKSVGINTPRISDEALLKEMIFKIMGEA
jgi:DNA polymerase III subunit delta